MENQWKDAARSLLRDVTRYIFLTIVDRVALPCIDVHKHLLMHSIDQVGHNAKASITLITTVNVARLIATPKPQRK